MSACRFLYPCKFTYIKFKKNFLRRAFRLAKSSIILLTSSFHASAFSIDKTTRPLNLSSCIMFRRYVLINFNLENDRSAVATVTVNVRNRRNYFFFKLLSGPRWWAPKGRGPWCTAQLAPPVWPPLPPGRPRARRISPW